MHKVALLVLLASALLMNACSDGGSDSPSDTNAHPESWFSTHAPEALADPGYDECKQCHAPDLRGSGDAVSCYSCHSYNTEPPFSIHPNWDNDYIDHRAYSAKNGYKSCTPCHGSTLRGYQTAPSCYSTSFNGQSCHPEGPQGAPHPIDEGYLLGINHGPDAKADLTVCQECHGQPGGPGSNPRFNVGIYSAGGTGCEGCHGEDYAHPQDWPDHYTAGNIQNACSLCHGVNLDGIGGVGTNCLECHNVSPGANSSGCASCHGQPPNSAAPVGDVRPNEQGLHDVPAHNIGISTTPSETCGRCHDGSGSGTAAHYNEVPPVGGFPPADVKIFHPDALDTIEATTTEANTTCTGNCHFGGIEYPHNNRAWY